MVSRCSPIWVEARRSPSSQKQSYLSLISQISWLQRVLLFPSRESAICRDLGLRADGTPSDNALIDGIKSSNSKFKPRVENELGGSESRRHHARDRELSGVGSALFRA